MIRPQCEVMYFSVDIVSESKTECPIVCTKQCTTVVCIIECSDYCASECAGINVDSDSSIGGSKTVQQVASPKNIVGFDTTFDH